MRKFAFVAVLASFASGVPARAEDWSIGPRKLPPPAHASEALRDLLAHQPAPKVYGGPAPATADEWKKLIDASHDGGVKAAEDVAEKFHVGVQEDHIGGVRVYRVTPAKIAPEHRRRLFVHIHGGAWIYGGGKAAAGEGVLIAARTGMPVISIDYRMPPDFPAPAAVDDITTVWRELIRTNRPARMALGGTSAGGNLTLGATLRIKELGLPLPAALMVGTPAADLAKTGDTRFLNEGVDHGLAWDSITAGAAKLYAGANSLTDPHLSPVYADVRGFPPSYLISGTRDLLLSDTVIMHRKLRKAGVLADLHVYEGIAHADYLTLFDTPESHEHFVELNAFLRAHLRR